MTDVFLKLLNISLTASWIVLAVVLFRVVMKKAPKWITCILWGIVGMRLILPFSFESVLSLIPSAETIDTATYSTRPYIETGVSFVDRNLNQYIGEHYAEGVNVPANSLSSVLTVISVIWIAGIFVLLGYSFYSYIRLKKSVEISLLCKDNIYYCDSVSSPFILGILKPHIYVPSGISEEQLTYVIEHENAHLKRGDHLWKPLGFLLLTVYWFNPVMWLAYILLCRDIEMACDEKVIKDMDNENKIGYSEALVSCSIRRNRIMACPLAFGEVWVKDRIMSVLNYKKPAFWLILLAVIVCLVFAVGFLTDPIPSKLYNIKDAGTYNTLLDNITEVELNHSGNTVYVNDIDRVNEIVSLLAEVDINSQPFSQNRSEDRDRTYEICLNGGNILCFSEDFSLVWIDDGVKPTLSYKVKNPEVVEKIYATYLSDEMVELSETEEEYLYADSIDPGTPKLLLQPVDQTFSFGWSAFSSYLAFGTYTLEDDILTCKTTDGLYTFVFKKISNGYMFDASKSSTIPSYKYSADSEQAECPVPDGAKFIKSSYDD